MRKRQSKTVSGIMLILLLMGMLSLAFNVQLAGSFVPPPTPQWTQTYGGASDEGLGSMVQTSDGGYALAGYTASYGAGSNDFWLVKTDSAGNKLWDRTYGGTGYDMANSLVQTSDGGYALAGVTSSYGVGYHSFWLVKTDPHGNTQWNKTYGVGIASWCYSMVQTSDGGYALFGTAWTVRRDIVGNFLLVKTDSNGNTEWSQTYGGYGSSVVQTGDGGYALAGSYGGHLWLVKTDSAGNMQWNQTYGGAGTDGANSVVQTSDGGYALAGTTSSYGAGGNNFWLVKTDSAGNTQWNQTYGGTKDDLANSVVQTLDGGYALAGITASYGAGSNDFWLIKTDQYGNTEWSQTYGGTSGDAANSVIQTNDGGFALAGTTASYGAGQSDFWLIKIGLLGPTASFTHSPEKPQVNDLVAFNASLSKPGWNDGNELPIVTYAWDFESDGVIDAYGPTATHAFPAVGTYTVTLNVTDAQGLWDTETHTIKVVSVEKAINDGVSWLVNQQNPDGSWGSWYPVAQTGLAVLKLEEHAVDPKYGYGLPSPFDPRYPYREHVEKGLNYLFANAHIIDISMQPAGNPDTNGNGKGIYFSIWEEDRPEIYEPAVAMMAIAGSRAPERIVNVIGSPVDGWTYRNVLQDAVDFLAFGQNDADWARGGWGYSANHMFWDEWTQQEWWYSDQSNTGWATFGLGFAESPTYKFVCTIPAFVKTELNIWIDYIQNDVNGDPDDGGAGYTYPEEWVNILKTGHLLYMMALVGDTATTSRVQDAVAYLVRHWNDPNTDPGWKGATGQTASYQATLNVMKGLFTLGIHKIDGIDWQSEFEHILKTQQLDDGSWPVTNWDSGGDRILSTEWALLTLEKVAPPPSVIAVYMDIKPGSWPNPLNLASNGVLPVAICGSADFDVTTINVTTIKLTREGLNDGVSPIRWDYEDVATPWTGEPGGGHALEGDGYVDLTLKFSKQEVRTKLGLDAFLQQIIPLIITGNLNESAGGTPITGQDYVWILDLPGDANDDGFVNSLDIGMLNAHWSPSGGAPPWSLGYSVEVDCNSDGFINSLDIGVVNANWGRHYP